MSKYAWATDVHLDFLGDSADRLRAFAESLIASDPVGIFLTGDISVSPKLIYHLSALERVVQRPTYFVLGNHDYYGSDVAAVRLQMKELGNISPYLRYLPTTSYVPLSQSTAVVGHDGWYDAQFGDWKNSSFMMADWSSIADFVPLSGGRVGMNSPGFNRASIVGLARKLAHEGALHVMNGIKQAVRYHKNIVVLTHFPPFEQSHIYKGQLGDMNAMPWYTNKMMADVLLDAAKAFPSVSFTVLAGHTHGKVDVKITKNLIVHVGGAEYSKPALQGLIEVA